MTFESGLVAIAAHKYNLKVLASLICASVEFSEVSVEESAWGSPMGTEVNSSKLVIGEGSNSVYFALALSECCSENRLELCHLSN